ncbi:MAG: secondary thiamine-phosphate synthase enzyme YjbQ [Candidatus Woesearchaeota archaeon]
MKSYTEYLYVETKTEVDFLNITSRVDEAVKKSGILEGLCLVNPMHITAAVYVNDAESGLIEDFKVWLERLAPRNSNYLHHQTGEDNADAHLKRILMGHQVTLPITGGVLDLGTWEQVYYAEFDGMRKKRIVIKIIGV